MAVCWALPAKVVTLCGSLKTFPTGACVSAISDQMRKTEEKEDFKPTSYVGPELTAGFSSAMILDSA